MAVLARLPHCKPHFRTQRDYDMIQRGTEPKHREFASQTAEHVTFDVVLSSISIFEANYHSSV